MTARTVPEELAITEAPRPLGDLSSGPEGRFSWRTLVNEVGELEHRVASAEAALRKADEAGEQALRALLSNLIEDVMDNLDRSLGKAGEVVGDARERRWFDKLRRARSALERLLAKEQVTPIDVTRAPPHLIVTEDVQPRTDVPDGTVVDVYLRGYLWRGEILRKPHVIVAVNPASAPSPGGPGGEE